MIALLQRVDSAEVHINKQIYNNINKGLLIFLGIKQNDSLKDINYLIDKIINLRIFNDDKNKMNLSIADIKGEILLISQFTLLADTKKGRRPSFIQSADPNVAEKLYNIFVNQLDNFSLTIKTGQFGAMMEVRLINDGPVTILVNSRKG